MKMLRIVSQKEGFRRCGVAHSTEATDHPMDRFTAEQIGIMTNDPMLYVHEIDPSADGMPDTGKEAADMDRALGEEKARTNAAEIARDDALKMAASESDRADAAEEKARAETVRADAAEDKARAETARADAAEKAMADSEANGKTDADAKGKGDAKK